MKTLACFSLFIFVFGCSSTNHFYDFKGNSLEKNNPIWNAVNKELRGYCPSEITVNYIDGNTSKFHPSNNAVSLNMRAIRYNYTTVLAHESAHLCLFNLTNGASNKNEFRFIDEGLASIIGAQAGKDFSSYEKQSLVTAKMKLEDGQISFTKIQNWKEYFGTPPKADYNAYKVGSSFVIFFKEKYGQDAFFSFLKDLGQTQNLKLSLQNTIQKDSKEVETEWQRFLSKVDLPPIPKVVQMFPKNGEKNVSRNTKEILVTFQIPMSKRISVGTRCDDGICYKNAYWKNSKTLAVKVDGKLKSNYTYRITIGTKRGGRLTSKDGITLPVTQWNFSTSSN